jgi:hypothetical protein
MLPAYLGMEKRDVKAERWYNKISKRSVTNLGMKLQKYRGNLV